MNARGGGKRGREGLDGAAAIVVRTIRGCISAFSQSQPQSQPTVAVSSLSTKLGVALITRATEHSGANDRHASESPRFCKQKLTAWVWAGSTPTSLPALLLYRDFSILATGIGSSYTPQTFRPNCRVLLNFQVNKVWPYSIENINDYTQNSWECCCWSNIRVCAVRN